MADHNTRSREIAAGHHEQRWAGNGRGRSEGKTDGREEGGGHSQAAAEISHFLGKAFSGIQLFGKRRIKVKVAF